MMRQTAIDSVSKPTVVWFKRDLRVVDHAPLVTAAKNGPVLPLYIVEPEYWALPDTSYRQWEFLRGCVADLADSLAAIDGTLCIRTGDACQVFRDLRAELGPFDLVAHMETGNAWTYRRDMNVHDWCKRHGVSFQEHQQFGVWRGRDAHRTGWSTRWNALMESPIFGVPDNLTWCAASSEPLPTAHELGLAEDGISELQPPGREAGLSYLSNFLTDRGEPYQKAMSSPVAGEAACSRMSPYLVSGSVSMREIYQATQVRIAAVAAMDKSDRGLWPGALKSYVGRLHWHCHFMQKLEAEPELEWEPMARSYKGLRTSPTDTALLDAFEAGQTGFPFVDACMRYLRATGWINFRMRAMLMSFASYNLWLPWQHSGTILARLFTDYEPGIHWSQSQMQSGETGINAVRIYSVVKQGYDQDPDGDFTRRWVPELAHLEGRQLQEPWIDHVVPNDYPARIVDQAATTKAAKDSIYAHRRSRAATSEAADVFEKHGSRKPRHARTDGARSRKHPL